MEDSDVMHDKPVMEPLHSLFAECQPPHRRILVIPTRQKLVWRSPLPFDPDAPPWGADET